MYNGIYLCFTTSQLQVMAHLMILTVMRMVRETNKNKLLMIGSVSFGKKSCELSFDFCKHFEMLCKAWVFLNGPFNKDVPIPMYYVFYNSLQLKLQILFFIRLNNFSLVNSILYIHLDFVWILCRLKSLQKKKLKLMLGGGVPVTSCFLCSYFFSSDFIHLQKISLFSLCMSHNNILNQALSSRQKYNMQP